MNDFQWGFFIGILSWLLPVVIVGLLVVIQEKRNVNRMVGPGKIHPPDVHK